MSLRVRLNLMIAATMLLILGLGFLFAVHSARHSVAEEIRSTVNLALQLIEAGSAESADTGHSLSGRMAPLERLGRTRHLRIRMEGAAAPAIDSGHPKRSREADVPAWFRWWVAPEPIVAEQRLRGADGAELGIRIEADSEDEIAESWQETQGFLVLLLVLAATVYLLVHFTVGRAFRSVGAILEGLEGIEKGDYGRRLPRFPLPEFDRISGAFNHMASALEKSRDENRALIRQSMSIQEEERRTLARELHDELGQSLTAIKVMAAAIKATGPVNREAAGHITSLCDRLFGMFRTLIRRLRPGLLDELGLAASLEDLVEDWRAGHADLIVDFSCEPGVDDKAGAARIHLFRIVQECLTNVVKHAEARRVSIRLKLEQTDETPCIRLRYGDDGRGFDPGEPSTGFGLRGMRERVAGLGGRFLLSTEPGRGVDIDIRVPVGGKAP